MDLHVIQRSSSLTINEKSPFRSFSRVTVRSMRTILGLHATATGARLVPSYLVESSHQGDRRTLDAAGRSLEHHAGRRDLGDGQQDRGNALDEADEHGFVVCFLFNEVPIGE